MSTLLDAEQLRSLLNELVKRMKAHSINGGIRIVGGAAIALSFNERRSTTDVDALLYPAEPILEIAGQMALDLNLAEDWLSDSVKQFVPFVSLDSWTEIISVDGAEVFVGSTELLLAMKLKANRGQRDSKDIYLLLTSLEIGSVEEVQAIFEKFHAQEVLSESAVIRVKDWLAHRESNK